MRMPSRAEPLLAEAALSLLDADSNLEQHPLILRGIERM